MLAVDVWRGGYGDPEPPVGPFGGLRDGNTIAYDMWLPPDLVIKEGCSRWERVFVLTDLGVSFSCPPWRAMMKAVGSRVPGIDPELSPPVTWYVDLVEIEDRGDVVIARDLYLDVMVPTDGRHQRVLDLDDYADAMESGDLPAAVAADGLRRFQRFLDAHLHIARDPVGTWTDFPPRQIGPLAQLGFPLRA